MLAEYFPVLVFLAISVVLGAILIATGGILGALLGHSQPNSEKSSPYECGFEAFEDTRSKFDVRYYLVAILFIIFDLEIAFFIPWALVLDKLGVFGLAAMTIFVLELIIGFFFVWKKGALEWE
ncbi:MAG: NAD(P)H-quinone oxidoreductase subunit 3 [Xanthomonadales bacterium]|nr:NADH-quinone oxidoreductase subunit A [Gammaproteobacteria bacterium]MBT8054485.1 NADH-quinone oxidoreductase subunit A [Gammaproteobacteria bacterium]NND57700.1 NAD(P)H-quinone oxidoreductase subunit 3 [Xanthomonadales bacterium]NNK52629.1 NAD(P)H-quinone oxidoreductase subunit 3 [Xanthomonadales bacterium]